MHLYGPKYSKLWHLFAMIFVGCNLASATSYTSVATPIGTFDVGSTWSGGSAPSTSACRDTIFISTHVYVDQQEDFSTCGPIVLYISDTLRFKSGPKLTLPSGSEVILTSGGIIWPEGVGSSSVIDVGTVTYWRAVDGPVSGPTVLPVDLLYFEAIKEKENVELNWATAMELNSSHFEIYRRSDDVEFELIQEIQSAGNSSEKQNYNYSDFIGNQDGDLFYKLAEVGLNGVRTELSTVRVRGNSPYQIELYPNPVNEVVTVYLSNESAMPFKYEILNNTGVSVLTSNVRTIAPNSPLHIDVSYLNQGTYILNLHYADQAVESELLIVQ